MLNMKKKTFEDNQLEISDTLDYLYELIRTTDAPSGYSLRWQKIKVHILESADMLYELIDDLE